MPIQSKAGQPYERRFDPPARRVAPNGTQPQTVFNAPLAFIPQGIREFSVFLPNADDLYLDLLFFGSDYPIKVSGVQQYEVVYDNGGVVIAIEGLSFAVNGNFPYGGASPVVPSIVTLGDPVKYQQILRGDTVTNGVRVQGFPYFFSTMRHALYDTDAGSTGDFAPFTLSLDVTLNSGGNVGPGDFIDFVNDRGSQPTAARTPVILWEGNMTQAIVDDGYQIKDAIYAGIPCPVEVVGLWASPIYSPVPGGLLEGKAATPFAAEPDATPISLFDVFRKRLSPK
jgi:hypothetical protein